MNIINITKNSVDRLFNRRKYFFLVELILTISLILAFKSIYVYYSYNYDILRMNTLISDKDSLYKVSSDYVTSDLNYYERFKCGVDELRDSVNAGIYFNYGVLISDNEYKNDINALMVSNNKREDGKPTRNDITNMVEADNVLLKEFNVRDTDGNIIKLYKEDNIIEIAIGYNFKDIVPVGAVLIDEMTGDKYVVKSIIEENARFIDGGIYNNEQVIELDNYFLSAVNTDAIIGSVFEHHIYFVGNKSEYELARNKVDEINEKYNIYLGMESFEQYEREYKLSHNDLYLFSMLLTIIMILAAIILFMVISFASWFVDFHDIGILCANGYTYSDIRNIIIVENMVKLIIPFMCAYSLNSFLLGAIQSKAYLWIVYFAVYMIFIVCTLAVSLITYRFIRKNKPIDLIKSE